MTLPNKLHFLIDADFRPVGALPSVMTALSAEIDSTAVRADYSLLISAFEFVSTLRDIALAAHRQTQCKVTAVAPGGYDVTVRSRTEDGTVFHAYV
jgi:hypothetical protein